MKPSEINILMSRCLKLAHQHRDDIPLSRFWLNNYYILRREKLLSQYSL